LVLLAAARFETKRKSPTSEAEVQCERAVRRADHDLRGEAGLPGVEVVGQRIDDDRHAFCASCGIVVGGLRHTDPQVADGDPAVRRFETLAEAD